MLRIKKSWRLKPRQEIHTTPMSSEHRGEGQKNVRARDYGETGRGTEKYRLLSKTWPWQPPPQSSSVHWHRSQPPNSRLWRKVGPTTWSRCVSRQTLGEAQSRCTVMARSSALMVCSKFKITQTGLLKLCGTINKTKTNNRKKVFLMKTIGKQECKGDQNT